MNRKALQRRDFRNQFWSGNEPVPCRNFVGRVVIACRCRADLSDLADVIVMMFTMGLRLKELREIRWSDVDFNQKRIAITTDMTGCRYVQISEEGHRCLNERFQKRQDLSLVFGPDPRRIIHTVRRQFDRLMKNRGVYMPIEALRWSYMAHLAADGKSEAEIVRTGICPQRLASKYVSQFQPAFNS